ncbi:hypothetical protein KIM372_04510 [Bombiscardovia nodaiensis]|uniref:Glycosyltransferase n=1 Tax=Bombiscardovia nodaiensis TaxID=2932181 RepID=A0ABN6S8Q7_9BIFI|nr:hypothetical protein KIM372_04510 [Bombiscardovia nodaiensis]
MTNQTPQSSTFDAVQISPVPDPNAQGQPPEPYQGIYPMPMFVTLPSPDLEESVRFWTQGLGFINLYSMPGILVHLRRWAFQDVLLVGQRDSTSASQAAQTKATQAERSAETGNTPAQGLAGSLSIAVAQSQIEDMIAACERLLPGSTTPPKRVQWRSLEAKVTTPEGLVVTLTAALPEDPNKVRQFLQANGETA